MKSRKVVAGTVLIFDTGDEVISALTEFASKNHIAGAHFTAIGAFSDATLGYFDLEKKDYLKNQVSEQVEVVSLIGDIALDKGKPKVHAHVVVGKRDGAAMGGHLLQAHVRPTLELVLQESGEELKTEIRSGKRLGADRFGRERNLMARFRGQRSAFGAPGYEAHWTDANKDGIGAAFSNASRVWFTIGRGILTEVYYPTVDRPQVRDLEFLFADGNGFFLEEKRDIEYSIERLMPSQGYSIKGHDRHRRLSLTKEVITDPAKPCVLLHTKLDSSHQGLKTYLLCAPHLDGAGSANNAFVIEVSGRELLVAEKNNRWMAIGASCGFVRLSCGYVGVSDGYTDLAQHHKMTFEFDEARNGNVALTGELNLPEAPEFTIGLAFGETLPNAISTLFQSLGFPYKKRRQIFMRQWRMASGERKSLEKASGDKGRLFDASYNLLLSHEDKVHQGAFVASLSIPWGGARNDENGKGGYHLVWTRDMVETAMGLLAAGNTAAPLRALIYLAARQEEDGGFPQNFWVNGEAFRNGTQLDEIAFPVLLAWRLHKLQLLGEFNPLVMVKRAAAFLLHRGPVTGEERWEETSGYSPSTLAAMIAAFVCAAGLIRAEEDETAAAFLETYADFLRSHLEEWTVTTKSSLVPDVPRCFVRLNPATPGERSPPRRGR